ncbi:MAG: PLP-dependent transferase [Parvibaculaceae bacterium]
MLAVFLEQHPRVRAVHYPGLKSHPGHAIACKQQAGFGAMLSFELDGDVNDVRQFVETVRAFTLAESLGGVESLIAHPATMTHVSMSQDACHLAGIGDTLLRLTVGLEAATDLQSDLLQAFATLGKPA